jgi:ribonuclease D
MASLKETKRKAWLCEEMAVLENKKTYEVDVNAVWQRLKCPFYKEKSIYLFAALCAWREKTAQLKNRPRRHILKDEALIEMAVAVPKKAEDFDSLRSSPKGFSQSVFAEEIIQVLEETLADKNVKKKYGILNKRTILTHAQKNLSELLNLLLEIISESQKVAPRIVASQEDLCDFITGNKESKIMSGWRFKIFGSYTQKLKEGKLSFRFCPQKSKIILEEEK